MSRAADEMKGADFGDQRLHKRSMVILERLGDKPSVSIPAACKGWGETLAAYRFFDNDNVTWDKVLSPHVDCTRARMAQESVALCIQDATEVSYGHSGIVGLGPLSYEKQRGLHLHPTLAVTPRRVALGVLDLWMWARDDETFGERKDRRRPIIEKESVRWVEGFQRVSEVAETLPQTHCVYVADRESDIYELLVAHRRQSASGADVLIRVTQTQRKLTNGLSLLKAVERQPALGEIEFDRPARDSRPVRRVTQTPRALEVELKPPRRADETLPAVRLTAILAREEQPPAGSEAVEWLLLTTIPITTLEQAAEKTQWYLCRWQIEIFFKILKSGCTVEKLPLERVERLEPALAFFMIVAWRVLFLTLLGRACPDLPCDVVFDTEEWRAVYVVAYPTTPPDAPPTLDEMIRMVAMLGGFLNRKKDGPPGTKTIWIGLQRTRDFVLALQAQRIADG